MVEPEDLLCVVAVKMKGLDCDIRSSQIPLQQTPEVLKAVGVDFTVHILHRVVHGFVNERLLKTCVGYRLIGINLRTMFDGAKNLFLESVAANVWNDLRANLAALAVTQLMDKVFSPNAPMLAWTLRTSQSEQDEQRGYHRLYSGAMLGIRNPVTHEFDWVEDQEVALELLVFAQHLLRKAKSAQPDSQISTP
jgi:uncharacterized protein (TIGR02391 family)